MVIIATDVQSYFIKLLFVLYVHFCTQTDIEQESGIIGHSKNSELHPNNVPSSTYFPRVFTMLAEVAASIILPMYTISNIYLYIIII